MFTGLIESTVPIVSLDNKDGNLRLCIEYPRTLSKVKMGDSISLNGVCLTISDIQERKLCVEIVQETATTSNMTDRTVGDLVNLERSLKVGDELGGHFLTGHIDGTGIIKKVRKVGGSITIWVSVPPELARFIVRKGSLGLEGVSLTVVDIVDYVLSVVVIPFTGNVTSLGAKTKGDRLNIEVDILGKHVHKSVQDILRDDRDLIRS